MKRRASLFPKGLIGQNFQNSALSKKINRECNHQQSFSSSNSVSPCHSNELVTAVSSSLKQQQKVQRYIFSSFLALFPLPSSAFHVQCQKLHYTTLASGPEEPSRKKNRNENEEEEKEKIDERRGSKEEGDTTDPPSSKKIMKNFHQSNPPPLCRYYKRGYCRNGEHCAFRHEGNMNVYGDISPSSQKKLERSDESTDDEHPSRKGTGDYNQTHPALTGYLQHQIQQSVLSYLTPLRSHLIVPSRRVRFDPDHGNQFSVLTVPNQDGQSFLIHYGGMTESSLVDTSVSYMLKTSPIGREGGDGVCKRAAQSVVFIGDVFRAQWKKLIVMKQNSPLATQWLDDLLLMESSLMDRRGASTAMMDSCYWVILSLEDILPYLTERSAALESSPSPKPSVKNADDDQKGGKNENSTTVVLLLHEILSSSSSSPMQIICSKEVCEFLTNEAYFNSIVSTRFLTSANDDHDENKMSSSSLLIFPNVPRDKLRVVSHGDKVTINCPPPSSNNAERVLYFAESPPSPVDDADNSGSSSLVCIDEVTNSVFVAGLGDLYAWTGLFHPQGKPLLLPSAQSCYQQSTTSRVYPYQRPQRHYLNLQEEISWVHWLRDEVISHGFKTQHPSSSPFPSVENIYSLSNGLRDAAYYHNAIREKENEEREAERNPAVLQDYLYVLQKLENIEKRIVKFLMKKTKNHDNNATQHDDDDDGDLEWNIKNGKDITMESIQRMMMKKNKKESEKSDTSTKSDAPKQQEGDPMGLFTRLYHKVAEAILQEVYGLSGKAYQKHFVKLRQSFPKDAAGKNISQHLASELLSSPSLLNAEKKEMALYAFLVPPPNQKIYSSLSTAVEKQNDDEEVLTMPKKNDDGQNTSVVPIIGPLTDTMIVSTIHRLNALAMSYRDGGSSAHAQEGVRWLAQIKNEEDTSIAYTHRKEHRSRTTKEKQKPRRFPSSSQTNEKEKERKHEEQESLSSSSIVRPTMSIRELQKCLTVHGFADSIIQKVETEDIDGEVFLKMPRQDLQLIFEASYGTVAKLVELQQRNRGKK